MAIDLSGYNAYWTFSPSSGIGREGGNCPWGQSSPLPTSPNFAILQNLGTVSQQFTTTVAGTHTIRLQAQIRWWLQATQTIKVKVDGATIGSPTGVSRPPSWSSLSFPVNIPTAGTHTLSIEG